MAQAAEKSNCSTPSDEAERARSALRERRAHCSKRCCSPPASRSTKPSWRARIAGRRRRQRRWSGCSADYASRGVNLARVGKKWSFRTAGDLSWLLAREQVDEKKLSRAAIETLAIIAYHQPVTRAEIEEIRGVAISKGTLDVLLETGWVRLRGRRKAPGRPITYGTTEAFLSHFGLEQLSDLPGLEELKGDRPVRRAAADGLPRAAARRTTRRLREDEDPLEIPATSNWA